jgi:hypothetical protein
LYIQGDKDCIDGTIPNLTAEQIQIELNAVIRPHFVKALQEKIPQFLKDTRNIDLGCNIVANISQRLVPYYDRALNRYLKH